jgi:ubiquinone/menaquinone biosynthesis C-methylase UbiE
MSSDNDERTENEKYKTFINAQLQENPDLFCALRREKQLDFLFPKIKGDVEAGCSTLLDLCCGYGRLIYFLSDEFPSLKIHGIDYLESLITKGRLQFQKNPKITFEVSNAFDISKSHSKEFDVTVIHKTLSWLPYYETIVLEAMRVSKNKIYITSLFWDGDIDFITKIFKNASINSQNNFSYINTYSLPKFKRFCLDSGAREVNFQNMHIDVDLPNNKNSDQLQTFTVPTLEGNRLELTGPIQLNWKLIEIIL